MSWVAVVVAIYDGCKIINVLPMRTVLKKGACITSCDYIILHEKWESATVSWIYSALLILMTGIMAQI